MSDDEDRFLELADTIGVPRVLATLREWRKWDDFLDDVSEDVIDANLAADKDEFDAIERENGELARKIADISGEANRLHEAICEGRRDDAIDILNEITGDNLRNVATQRNLFPDRVPA